MELPLVKKSKILLFCLIGIAIGIGGLSYFSSKSYFAIYPVTYTRSNHPVVDVKLGNDTHALLDVSIGSRFPLFLSKEILDQIEKKPQGTTEWHDLTGKRHEEPSYLIPKMKIGKLTVTNVTAIQASEKGSGLIGKYLGGEFNLLLDFPHSRIIACHSFAKLKAKKIVNDSWIQVSFEPVRMGIVFQVNTDMGTCNLALSTTCTTSTLRPSLTQSKKTFISSKFCIGEIEFRTTSLEPLELPDAIHEIDGFIGMDFLKKHTVYLDYSNKIAYFEPSPTYLERFPISFEHCGMPTIEAHIESNTYPLVVDLGSFFLFSLCQEVLQNIQKTSYGMAEWKDFKGNEYQSPTHTVPEIKIGNQTLFNSIVRQSREDFHANVTLKGSPDTPVGVIGQPILEKYNLFLDFKNSAIYISNSLSSLQEKGLFSKHFLTIPFTLHKDGMMFPVETDIGILHLLLDTGATCTVVRAPCPVSTTKFSLMGHDFGTRSILPIDLVANDDYDGFLGMDFLREYSIFIDYPNKLIYLDLQKDGSLKDSTIFPSSDP